MTANFSSHFPYHFYLTKKNFWTYLTVEHEVIDTSLLSFLCKVYCKVHSVSSFKHKSHKWQLSFKKECLKKVGKHCAFQRNFKKVLCQVAFKNLKLKFCRGQPRTATEFRPRNDRDRYESSEFNTELSFTKKPQSKLFVQLVYFRMWTWYTVLFSN